MAFSFATSLVIYIVLYLIIIYLCIRYFSSIPYKDVQRTVQVKFKVFLLPETGFLVRY